MKLWSSLLITCDWGAACRELRYGTAGSVRLLAVMTAVIEKRNKPFGRRCGKAARGREAGKDISGKGHSSLYKVGYASDRNRDDTLAKCLPLSPSIFPSFENETRRGVYLGNKISRLSRQYHRLRCRATPFM